MAFGEPMQQKTREMTVILGWHYIIMEVTPNLYFFVRACDLKRCLVSAFAFYVGVSSGCCGVERNRVLLEIQIVCSDLKNNPL